MALTALHAHQVVPVRTRQRQVRAMVAMVALAAMRPLILALEEWVVRAALAASPLREMVGSEGLVVTVAIHRAGPVQVETAESAEMVPTLGEGRAEMAVRAGIAMRLSEPLAVLAALVDQPAVAMLGTVVMVAEEYRVVWAASRVHPGPQPLGLAEPVALGADQTSAPHGVAQQVPMEPTARQRTEP